MDVTIKVCHINNVLIKMIVNTKLVLYVLIST